MKLKSILYFLILAPAVIFSAQGCDKCNDSGTITLDEGMQSLGITYVVDSNGANYAQTVWNPNNVHVLVSTNGMEGPFNAITEDLSDGMIGPLSYTTKPSAVSKGRAYDYVYIVRKDTFDVDTLQIKFYPAVDECHEFWSQIEYYRNGVAIGECTGQEICTIEVRE